MMSANELEADASRGTCTEDGRDGALSCSSSTSDLAGSDTSSQEEAGKCKHPNDASSDTDLEIEDEKPEYYLSGSRIYLETCEELGVVPASYFIRHIHDEDMVMRHHGLGPLGAKALAIPLVTNTSVTSLDLKDNWIQSEGAVYLAEMLKENCYIAHLSLADNQLGHEGALSMCDMLQQNCSLTSINLAGNGFSDKDAEQFAEAILNNSRIRELNLSRNEFGMGAGFLLGHAIGENETIENVDFSWNHFRGRAAMDVVEGIKVNSRLKRVNLSWNGLGNDGAAAVAECIKHNHVLSHLDIGNNRITIEGIVPLAKAMDVNETLVSFKIGQNAIGADGAMLLMEAIHNERSVLTELDLTDVCVDKKFDDLHKTIQQSRTLTVNHGGVLGSFSQQPPPKKDKDDGLDADELAALRALEDFLQNDPMALLQAHVKRKNLRLVDLFREFDKNKDYKIGINDLKRGVKQAGIELSDEKIEELANRLDKAPDGRIDYSSLAFGKARTTQRQRRLSRVVLDTFESTGRRTLPADITSSPVLGLINSKLLKIREH